MCWGEKRGRREVEGEGERDSEKRHRDEDGRR